MSSQAGPEYSVFEGEYYISPNETKNVNIKLHNQSKRALLSIRSNPAGAKIFINGNYWGNSPLLHKKVNTGTHKIEMGLQGYKTWQNDKRFQINENLHLFVELIKN